MLQAAATTSLRKDAWGLLTLCVGPCDLDQLGLKMSLGAAAHPGLNGFTRECPGMKTAVSFQRPTPCPSWPKPVTSTVMDVPNCTLLTPITLLPSFFDPIGA